MKKFKKIWLASFLSIYLLAGLLLFVPVSAQASIFDPTKNIDFTPQIGVPNSEFTAGTAVGVGNTAINAKGETVIRSDLLARYINAFYQWGLSIVAVIAVVVLMAGGVMWIASAGDSSLVTKAKEMIFGSLSGMALLIGAWFFLNTINPQLTQLPALETVIINKINMGCCDVAKVSRKAEMTSDTKCSSGFSMEKQLSAAGICEQEVCCIIQMCDNAYGCTNPPTIKNCVDTLAGTCTTIAKKSTLDANGINFTSTTKIGLCDSAPECSQKIVSCAGKDDASMGLMINQQKYWCYGGKFYFGIGKVGEPCGNEPYSKCTTEYLSNAADWNGRDCCNITTPGCTRAFCNKFKEDGSKKYDQDIQK